MYVLVLFGAFAASTALRAVDLVTLGYAVSLLATAGVLVHAFIKSGRDTRPARTWAESWRRRHLLMIALSLVLGFSGVLLPNADESAWVLLPIFLAMVPLAFTPLTRINGPQPEPPEPERPPLPWRTEADDA